MKSEPQPPTLLALPATAIAYLVVGWLALWLAVTPSYAAPLYPAAGIALACVLTYGLRVLPAVALGAFGVNLLLSGWRTQPGALFSWATLVLPLVIAMGATLQAAVGALLVRRFVSQPLTLSEPRDVARFFVLGALLACTVSASVATTALHFTGALPDGSVATTWSIWWAGDALGVLIGAPVVLTLIGRPRADWKYRRAPVALSLVLVTALLATATAQVGRWDDQRTRVIFERDAGRAADALMAQLNSPLHALEAVRGAASAFGVSREGLHKTSAYWLVQPFHIKAMGWSERVARSDIPRFENAVRAELAMPNYRVFDRADADASPAAREDSEVVAMRYIEPMPGNQAALGVNPLSIASARPAIEATRSSGRPAASAGFRLTQETGDQTGVVLYQAVYSGQPTNDAERRRQMLGVMFVTLRMEEAVRSVAAPLPSYLQWCVVDTEPRSGRARLAGPIDCDRTAVTGLLYSRAIEYAGRHWELRLSSPVAAVPDSRHWNAWLFSLVGLMATSMLGAMLLSVTGRTRRIEVAVAERTVDLQHEVAERARTEAALRESEQRFRNILDHVPIGLIYTDLNGRIQEANPKLRDLIGYTPEELVGMSILHLTHPQDRAADVELGRRLIQGVLPMYRRQKRYIARDGSVLWVQATVSTLRDAENRPQRLVGVVEDITEHLKLQDAERARESAEAANRAKSDFVSRMSHELRTPLNAMLGFAQLLELDRQAPLRPHQMEWTSQIQHAGWHLLHMINDTLDLSRIEAGTLRLELQPVPVAQMVEATIALVKQAAERRHITISEQLDPAAPLLLGDETRVKQILTNLLSNAVKYNVEGGRVVVRSRLLNAETVALEVVDTGLGLSPAQMAELFQPFNRLGREAYGEGTGIGLVISRRLAELMDGSLTAQSAVHEGSCFRLQLPLAHASHAAPLAHDTEPAHLAEYHQRLVHYIEDNETNAEVMRGILAQRPQVRLKVSATGLDGLAAIRQEHPGLVLLDMHLPDVDGLELLRHLKQDERTADIPVIVVSADATGGRIDQAMALGAAHYVTKPVNVSEILSLLDNVLEQQDTRFSTEL